MVKTSIVRFVLLAITLCFSMVSRAALNPEARYYTGKIKVFMSNPVACYVEVVSPSNSSQVKTRAVMSLPHLSSQGQTIPLAVGAYVAQFVASKSLYRYQDTTPAAPVKDLVLNVVNNIVAKKFSILYWHKSAGHHDPIVCDDLVEAVNPESLQIMDDVFSRFEDIQLNNP